MLSVFDSAESYQRKPVTALMLPAGAEELARFSVCGLTGRLLAFAVFQDLNNNGRIDMNLLGIPSEPWGSSGQPPQFSAPTWASSQVKLDALGLNITLSP